MGSYGDILYILLLLTTESVARLLCVLMYVGGTRILKM